MVDFFKQNPKQGMNAIYYGELIEQLRKIIPKKRYGLLSRGPIILQDNAKIHGTQHVIDIFNKHSFEHLLHPPYSPDIAPCDYYLFRSLKSYLRGKNFLTEEETKEAVLTFFESKPEEFYKKGIDELKTRLKRLIELEGEYVVD